MILNVPDINDHEQLAASREELIVASTYRALLDERQALAE